jgi:hypothetical protein
VSGLRDTLLITSRLSAYIMPFTFLRAQAV